MTTPPGITWGHAPGGLSDVPGLLENGWTLWSEGSRLPEPVVFGQAPGIDPADLATWERVVRRRQRRFAQSMFGKMAPRRRRRRRVQKKIDARFGAMHYRNARAQLLRALLEATR